MEPHEPEHKTTEVPNLIENQKKNIANKTKKPIRFVASGGKGDSIKIYHKGRPFLKFRTAKYRFKNWETFPKKVLIGQLFHHDIQSEVNETESQGDEFELESARQDDDDHRVAVRARHPALQHGEPSAFSQIWIQL